MGSRKNLLHILIKSVMELFSSKLNFHSTQHIEEKDFYSETLPLKGVNIALVFEITVDKLGNKLYSECNIFYFLTNGG